MYQVKVKPIEIFIGFNGLSVKTCIEFDGKDILEAAMQYCITDIICLQ